MWHPSACGVSLRRVLPALAWLIIEDSALGRRKPALQLFRCVALREPVLLRDQSLPPKSENMVVEELHSMPRTRLDRRCDPENLVLANEVRNTRRHDEGLKRRHAPAADFLQ